MSEYASGGVPVLHALLQPPRDPKRVARRSERVCACFIPAEAHGGGRRGVQARTAGATGGAGVRDRELEGGLVKDMYTRLELCRGRDGSCGGM